MTVAVTHALASGAKAVICASTGNTSASAAAYAAAPGMTSAVLVPQGKIAAGKLAQAVAYGARILQIEGNFDDCLELARKTSASSTDEIALVNSVNPVRIEGQKTAAFEICDVLGRAPDVHCLPVGNAGNITAYWKGYREYAADGVVGIDAADVRLPGGRRGAAGARAARCSNPDTIATAIRIGAPASWTGAIDARDSSRRADRRGHRRADPGGLPAARDDRGSVRGAGVRRLRRRAAGRRPRTAGCRADRWWCAR